MIPDGPRDWRSIAHVLGAIVLVVVVGAVVLTAVPGIVGADASYVVRSDSMSPAIDAGSVVFVTSVPAETLSVGDVITFRSAEANKRITHRIVEVVERDGERSFRTKGDANEEADDGLVSADQIVGRVAFSLPLVGWLLAFAQSPVGIVLFLIVPAVLLAANELWDLYKRGEASGGGEDL